MQEFADGFHTSGSHPLASFTVTLYPWPPGDEQGEEGTEQEAPATTA